MDAAARTKLETDLAGLNARYNALVQDEQVQLAKSQTLEMCIRDSSGSIRRCCWAALKPGRKRCAA